MTALRALSFAAIVSSLWLAQSAGAETLRYRLNPELSWLEYEADSLFGSVIGRNQRLEGELVGDPAEVFKTAAFKIVIPVEAFDSGWDWRDEDVRELLQADRFPRITLTRPTVLRWTPFPNPTAPTGADGEAAVWVSFRGVQAQEGALFRIDRDEEGRLLIRGKAETSMAKYRIKPPSVMFYESEPEMTIRFELFFDPAGEETPSTPEAAPTEEIQAE